MNAFLKRGLSLVTVALGMGVAVYAQSKASIVVNADQGNVQISRHIYGHFSEHLGHCIYGGFYVGEDSPIPNTKGIRNDVVEALKNLRIPNLRWPGGCFADEYHWMDGIGPKENRPKMVNTHWGGVTEDNSFGTHDFLDMCELIGTEPYICGNVGSGTVEEMSKWVEYMTFDGESPMSKLRKENGREKPWKVQFLAVGNESWGCGGEMTPEFYADNYRRYQTFCRNYGDNHLLKVAGGANVDDYNWTEVMMKRVPARFMWGLSLHYYTHPGGWDNKGSATQFTPRQYAETMKRCLKMDELVTRHDAIMTKYDPKKRVALVVDEWGSWYDVEPGTNPGFLFQQNTMRDALIAASTLNIFHKHADRVKMANLAQIINVLQAVIFTDGDKMLLTPTYHIFDMYKIHQDATLLPSVVKTEKFTVDEFSVDQVNASASVDKDGVIHVSVANLDLNKSVEVSVDIRGVKVNAVEKVQVLTSDKINDYNSFEKPNKIQLTDGAKNCKLKNGVLTISMPAKSVVTVAVK
ncbi:MAG: alpha-N-arabinofuranosidase [Bacteroidales bacterium]|nr:alpha-N-arabinofuranosidase [Bacteroidales bacterium]